MSDCQRCGHPLTRPPEGDPYCDRCFLGVLLGGAPLPEATAGADALWVGDTEGTDAPGLPADFQSRAANRLGWFGLLLAVAVVAVGAVNLSVHVLAGWRPSPDPLRTVCQGLFVLLSVGLYVVVRNGPFRPATLLSLGLVYEVLGAFLIAVASVTDPAFVSAEMIKVSWLCVWITLFPLVVPNTIARNLVASLLAACAVPIVLAGDALLGGGAHSTHAVWHVVLPPFMCAGLALVPAYLIHHLTARASRAEATARRLGSYTLVEVLGQGGMGEVWRAKHSLLARPAAVKLIKSDVLELLSPGKARAHLERFKREANATADLTSPHTVRVYDFGITGSGAFYYVMELLDGKNLESMVSRAGPMPPARAVHLLRQVCSSLAEAHASGLVHRDVKPANLMCCRRGLIEDFVKVLDFGLVAASEGDRTLTAERARLGSPAFMAPETIRHGAQGVDSRVDIYGIGAVAYWLLTGTLLFPGANQALVMDHHLNTAPEPPSERVGRPIPEPLEQLVLACLAKDPADRPGSVEVLGHQLEELVVEVGSWTQEDARGWWAARRLEALAPTSSSESTLDEETDPLGGAETTTWG